MGLSRRLCYACEFFCCTLLSWFPRAGVNALMFWGVYTHTFSIVPHVLADAGPLPKALAIAWVGVLYVFAFAAYFETVRIGGGSPLDVSSAPSWILRFADFL